ncbi:MAG: ASCH domain-containing protein [Clostridia bacterium]|nr:ASCH domain-containing protein [Clostridia bacterium]
MIHKMRLNEAPFHKIKSGEKTIELRLYDEKRQKMAEGDEIEFINRLDPEETVKCRIVKMHVFDSFDSLYKSLPLLKCGYTEEDVQYASANDMNEYYSIPEQEKYGVVGIELELL